MGLGGGVKRWVRRPLPLHPLGFAAVPVLVLYARNVKQGASVRDALGPLLLVLGVTGGALLVLTVAFRGNGRKAAVLGSLAVALFFAYGPVVSVLGATTAAEIATLAVAACVIAGVAVLVVRARPGALTTWTRGLNVVAAGLVVLNVASATVATVGRGGSVVTTNVLSVRGGGTAGGRDIFLIVLDDYGGQRAMKDLLGFDNEPFLDALRARGFFVPTRPTTNYPHTADALGAELNLDYVQRLLRDPRQDDWSPANDLLKNDEVPRFLKARGYRYVNIGSWWAPTASNPQADVNVKMKGTRSEFTNAFIAQTLPGSDSGPLGQLSFAEREYLRVKFQLTQIENAAKVPGRTFVFGHLLVPHRPFVFGVDGRYVDAAVRAGVPDSVGYVNQLRYVNTAALRLVDRLLAVPSRRRPIIVLQSDEGFYSGLDVRSDALTDRDIEQHFGTLESFYFPGLRRTGLYDSITLVNVFRLLFDDYFGTRLPLLPDRNYVARDATHLYQFVDVTDRVRPLS